MRKMLAVAVAAVLVTGAAIVPSQAATAKVGAKCTTKLALAKVGTSKVYCGLNTNAKTKKLYKFAWVKDAECYAIITEYKAAKAQTDPLLAEKDALLAKITTDLAKIDTTTLDTASVTNVNNIAASMVAIKKSIAEVEGLSKQAADGVAQACP